jgi:hypothetical protein
MKTGTFSCSSRRQHVVQVPLQCLCSLGRVCKQRRSPQHGGRRHALACGVGYLSQAIRVVPVRCKSKQTVVWTINLPGGTCTLQEQGGGVGQGIQAEPAGGGVDGGS